MKQFHIGDILTVTTGKLVSLRHMEGVYEILNFMCGDSLYTHQLPRASKECRPYLIAQHPQLAAVTGDEVTPENFGEWLAAQVATHGEYLPVNPLPAHAHEFIDPLSELAEKVHPDRIIPIVI